MREKILDYLTIGRLLDKDFKAHPNQRIRTAYILAQKDYKKLSEEEKQEIWEKILKRKEE
tara:strand:+ start:583 stop:762 length:180 start_codon:yes stop_codon:yes gene_type:complete